MLCSAEKSSVILAEPHSRSSTEQLGTFGKFGRSLLPGAILLINNLEIEKSKLQVFKVDMIIVGLGCFSIYNFFIN